MQKQIKMFSSFSSPALKSFLTKSSNAVVRYYSSALQQTRTRAKEFQRVNLIGTIYQEPTILNSGTKVLSVKTVQSDNFYKLHRVVIGNPNLLKMLGENLSEGQRVYISGHLQSNSFFVTGNRQRQSFQIAASEVFVTKLDQTQVAETELSSEDGEIQTSNQSIDLNSVSIMSFVASEVEHFETSSTFALCSHHVRKNPTEGEEDITSFFRVFVHDKNVINYLRTSVQKRDRVIVNGFLNSKPEMDQNGKKKYGGYIEGTHIVKVDRLSKATIDEHVESA